MNKVAQGDFLLPVESKQVSELDIADLPDGEYRILLITYDLATATSLNGVNLIAGQPFERSYDASTFVVGDADDNDAGE